MCDKKKSLMTKNTTTNWKAEWENETVQWKLILLIECLMKCVFFCRFIIVFNQKQKNWINLFEYAKNVCVYAAFVITWES